MERRVRIRFAGVGRRCLDGLKLIYLIFFVSLIPAIFLTGIVDSFNNTLFHNGKWIPSKILLKKGVMGANDFYFSRNALANGHLDLSCWHGYQEVVYKKTLAPADVAFDFILSPSSYLIFEFNKNEHQFSGIRLSTKKRFKSIYFISSDEGEFLFADPLNVPYVEPGKWNRAKIIFGKDLVSFYLNEQFFGSVKISLLQGQKIGFRGGINKVLIDNVAIRERGSLRVIREDFDNNSIYFFFCVLLCMLLLNCIIYYLLSRFASGTPRQALFSLITCSAIQSIVLISIFFLYDCFAAKRYFHIRKTQTILNAEKGYWFRVDARSIAEKVRKGLVDAGFKNDIKILFIGSSQTWGAGARNEKETFVKRIERRLNSAAILNRHFACINAGVSAEESSSLLERYTQEQLVLEPQIVVIVLSNNDKDPVQFADNLRRFADLNISKGIKTIFVLEANALEDNPRLLMLHKVMMEVGNEKGVPVLDLHSYLLQNYDKGLLWWDVVHLSSFGQKLASDYIFEEISKEIYSSAMFNKSR